VGSTQARLSNPRGALLALTLALAAVALASGCQTRATGAIPAEEASNVRQSVSSDSFVPPPRTIGDITAILDQQKREKPEVEVEARRQADQPPPDSKDPATLAAFYFQRAAAALKIGRGKQAIDDLTLASQHVAQAPGKRGLEMQILWRLYGAETNAGSYTRAVAALERARERASPGQRGWLSSSASGRTSTW
jgi:tetratricopeptide (TPR) repeat protein